ncbi:MAG: hypothetical protein JKY30_14165, partial [Flavobacteriales bacterium]|nr:hypothetical protein [Flavobacteriales bacterium]
DRHGLQHFIGSASWDHEPLVQTLVNAYRSFWRSYYDVRKITHYDFEMKKVIK